MTAELDVAELLRKRNTIAKEITQLQERAAVAKADEERIGKELVAALATLKETYGCSSQAEAEELLQTKVTKANQLVKDLEERLDVFRR